MEDTCISLNLPGCTRSSSNPVCSTWHGLPAFPRTPPEYENNILALPSLNGYLVGQFSTANRTSHKFILSFQNKKTPIVMTGISECADSTLFCCGVGRIWWFSV